MKTRILLLLILSTKIIYAQDTIVQQNSIYEQRFTPVEQHAQFFGFTPMSKKINKVNFAFGLGHVENRRIANQTINGLNLEVNPAPVAAVFVAFLAIMHLPDVIKNSDLSSRGDGEGLKIKNWEYSPYLKINGLNLSTGCFFTTASMNGLNISLANKFNDFNGASVTVLGTIIDTQNGVSIGIYNANNSLKGATVGFFNQSYELKGIHVGLINAAKYNRGVQVGIYNRSYSKGFQIGVWNKNAKRSFPIVNW
ncbi:hypothetical protein IVB69_03585 [Flavobacterium sp. J49]|uniref:hypothetical protein n=1 Tax=Flavobacterium sp. J49 TaxID=2718534 RepID=UPI001593C953|nr:hypothetical protein [Flavobacterium sp. J49]MBF6640552.1 hypothetical protein [Flavobacterium sp. J49]NIC01799.1 hypothetical protein [Flavobacterium sp. J49]